MAKSIIQEDKTYCFLCGQNAFVEPLEEHHVYGGSNRKISEKYGLKVYLHSNKCHKFGKYSVHRNAEINKALKAKIQNIAIEHFGWSVEDFIKKIGKSYI